jgi:uncharacterized protein
MSSSRRLPIIGVQTPTSATIAAEQASLELFASGGAEAVGAHALGWHEEATREIMERLAPAKPIDCAEGCAYCCHLKVIASPPEVIHLARHIRATRDAAALSDLLDRLRLAHEKTRRLATNERAELRMPCPLLVNGRCSAYEARPLHCAGANSLDATACAAAFEGIDRDLPVPMYRPQAQLADVIAAGIARASFGAGRFGAMLELIHGLLLALEDPTREEAWERGEDAFSDARDRELEALIAASQ